jgi:hypothetical protein
MFLIFTGCNQEVKEEPIIQIDAPNLTSYIYINKLQAVNLC